MRWHHGSLRWVSFVHDGALIIIVVVISFAVKVGWTLVLVCAAILFTMLATLGLLIAQCATYKVVPLKDLSNIRGRIFV